MYKKLAIAFSVANLCFFKAWRELLSPQTPARLYFWKQYPNHAAALALLIDVMLLSGIFYLGFMLLSRYSKTLARLAFLVIFLRALNGVRVQFELLTTSHLHSLIGRPGFFVIGTSLLLLLILAGWRYGLARVARVAAIVALILAPFGLIGAVQVSWLTVKHRRFWHDQPPAPSLQTSALNQPRVVWIIFDEMSEEGSFTNRPASLEMPNFDRLRREALVATNAYPPAGHTVQSMPALLTGKLIASVQPSAPNELLLTFPDQKESVAWTSEPDIFSRVRAIGLNSSLVGWFHPYCRMEGNRLTSCFWQPSGLFGDPDRSSLSKNLLRQQSDMLALAPFTRRLRSWMSPGSPEDYRTPHLAVYEALIKAATNTVADPSVGLSFIHLPVPHPPYIYDRQKGTWDTRGERQYLDNLALSDRALGELRAALERARLWEDTTVIVSSDHWWRTDLWRPVRNFWSEADAMNQGPKPDHRIPFMIRLGRQERALRYEAPFNTVLTHDLILELLNRRVSKAEEIRDWIDLHKTIGESPYQSYDDPQ
jgi:hypothetical protein